MNANTRSLDFQGTAIPVVVRAGQQWIGVTQLGQALGYANPETAVTKIFNRHRDEFSSAMTKIVNLMTADGKRATRIFSLRGAHLIAMFARTAVAKAFRVWVLDVLDAELERLRGEGRKVRQPASYHYPLASADSPHREFGNYSFTAAALLDETNPAPELELIAKLERDGHDVEGARLRIQAMRVALKYAERTRKRLANWETRICALMQEVKDFQIEHSMGVVFEGKITPLVRMAYQEQFAPRTV